MKTTKFQLRLSLLFISPLLFVGCASGPQIVNDSGIPTTYQDPSSPGIIKSTGIESQDIQSMVDKMVRHMLLNPQINNPATPPRVIMDIYLFQLRKLTGHC